MENQDRKYSLGELQSYPYRSLQRMAKSMGLPSNVKKYYLIQMIHAKKFKTKEELDDIVLNVMKERKQVSQAKKKKMKACKRSYLQRRESSSTSLSPPIYITPKRAGYIVSLCSPENIREPNHSYLTRNATSIYNTYSSPKKSDRILRSFNVKTTKNITADTNMTENSPKATIRGDNVAHNSFGSLSDPMFSVLSPESETIIKEMQEFTKTIPPEQNMVKKYKPNVSKNLFGLDSERSQLIPVTRNVSTVTIAAAKPRRVLSGIYPIIPKEQPKVSYEYLHRVEIRRQDGKIAKINAVVQKRKEPPQNTEVTVQDIINCSITQTFSNSDYVNSETLTHLSYSNTNLEEQRHDRTTDLKNESDDNIIYDYEGNERCDGNKDDRNDRYDNETESKCEEHSYYHKKIKAEQARSKRSYQREAPTGEERLPDISAFFSFGAHSHATQPNYVQVSGESDRCQNYPAQHMDRTNTNLLENLYNFRSPFIVNQPLQQIPTATNTKCVYSSPVMSTAMAQQSVALDPEYTASSCEQDNTYDADLAGVTSICELFGVQDFPREFKCDEVLCPTQEETQERVFNFSSSSSVDETISQDLSATVNIPEMVEDALEIISQDGDYMERIGMDVGVQCVICFYVCPKYLLEYHLRKEHSSDIHLQEQESWNMSFTLASLARASTGPRWASRVLQHDAALFVLSVACGADDCLRATLTALTTDTNLPKSGSITIYNKVSGEPYAWEGEIRPLPNKLPYENDTVGLTVPLAKLELLPNSANLKLENGEFVLKSPTKVVVGQPELNDIHVILFVKILS